MAMPVCESCGSEFELEALPELEGETGSEGEGWLGAIGNVVGSLLGEQEFASEFEGEGEFETESEFESEISPIRKIYPDAMMEHLGELAAEAETEQEAVEHFLPLVGMAASKLLPLAAKALAPAARKALPRIANAVARATPHLTRGVGKIARTLHRQPAARSLLRAVPAIARRTVHSIAQQAARGRLVTPRNAVRTLARQTRRVLGSPGQRAQALRRHHLMDRRFHGRWGRGTVRPHWQYRRVGGQVARVPYGVGPSYVGAPVAPGPQYAGGPGVSTYGRIVDGRCVCPACPTCGAAVAPVVAQTPAVGSAAPAYCRCCGQLLR